MATLINKTNRTKVINLDHPAFRDKKYGFERKPMQVNVTDKDGRTGTAIENRSITGSITLLPLGRIEDLHPAIKNCSQVRTMLLRGEVEILSDDAQGDNAAAQSAQTGTRPRGARRTLTETNNG